MYQLVFGRPANYKVIAESDDPRKLREMRRVSGDIVLEVLFDSSRTEDGVTKTQMLRRVSPSHVWLWDWELDSPDCYARRMQAEGWTY